METKTPPPSLTLFENLWDDSVADQLDPVERLVYRSNLLGSDWRITNTGGGNTSSKIQQADPLTDQPTEVLWVKGSGGDLRTAKRENFSSLYQDKLLALQQMYGKYEERGPKSKAEDSMVSMYAQTTFNLNPRPPSIDTPLHAFIPHAHIDHMHPVSCIALATAEIGPELTLAIYGDDVQWLDWQRPGFELGLALQEVCEKYPEAHGVILGGHGLINWADDDKECYLLSLRLINQAAQYLGQHYKGQNTLGGSKYASLG
jgi:rhamnose utilization protein RhaD (predicted bifunctional aldolase and dehydrogenase)